MKVALAPICSVFTVLHTFLTLSTCLRASDCGTPCAGAISEFLLSPIFLVLPFVSLLWARNLSRAGVVARGAATCALTVWLVAFLVLHYTHRDYGVF